MMKGQRKTRLGRVVSDRMDKTVVVAVETPKRHPLYKKAIRRAIKYKAHDENNECQVGDVVRIIETRPLSEQKRWRVAEVITKGEAVEVKPEEIT
jgi:small subunit ribosomal protein S17